MLAGSCIWSAVNKYQNGMVKVTKKAFNVRRSGTQYVAMVTEPLSSYWRAHLVESYCKVSNISNTNWLRYPFSSYLNKIWLSVWHHHLANLHILKTSVERKEISKNSKQHFSAHEVYLFMFQNGLHREEAIFVIVPLKRLIKTKIFHPTLNTYIIIKKGGTSFRALEACPWFNPVAYDIYVYN